jgi:hypothetical protein
MKLIACAADTAIGPIDSPGALEGEEAVDLAAYRARLTADGEPNLETLAAFLESTSMN